MKYSISIAIVSDLHCHYPRKTAKLNESYLLSNMLRDDPKSHPVQGLIDLISEKDLKTNLLLCPGDITDQSDIQGYISGWGFILEIGSALDSSDIIATIGNHDVDSRNKDSTYSYDNARAILRGYPINDTTKVKEFWGDGFTIIENDNIQLLVINSCFFHHNIKASSKGKINIDQLNKIETNLKSNLNDKIKIAMIHHHPITHPRLDLGDEDIIDNGGKLLELLGNYDFDLVVHGHKHDPLLRNHITSNGKKIPVFSSGSFSANSQIIITQIKNTFHYLEISKESNQNCKGELTTYSFVPKKGWFICKDPDGFSPKTGFGFNGDIKEIGMKIIAQVGDEKLYLWEKILEQIPEINNLIPSELELLENILAQNNLEMGVKISQTPKYISKIDT